MIVLLNNISFNVDNVEAMTVESQKKTTDIVLYTPTNRYTLYSVSNNDIEDIVGTHCISIAKRFYDNVIGLRDSRVTSLIEKEKQMFDIIAIYHDRLLSSELYREALEKAEDIKRELLMDGDGISSYSKDELEKAYRNIESIEESIREIAYKDIDSMFNVGWEWK